MVLVVAAVVGVEEFSLDSIVSVFAGWVSVAPSVSCIFHKGPFWDFDKVE